MLAVVRVTKLTGLLKRTVITTFSGTDVAPLAGSTDVTDGDVVSTTPTVWKEKLPALSICNPLRLAIPALTVTVYCTFGMRPCAGVIVTRWVPFERANSTGTV